MAPKLYLFVKYLINNGIMQIFKISRTFISAQKKIILSYSSNQYKIRNVRFRINVLCSAYKYNQKCEWLSD